MATQNLSEHVLLITLPAEPSSSGDLEAVVRSTRPGSDHDVVVDFSRVEILPSATICNLIVLERVLSAAGHRLVLCSVPPDVKAVFRRVGLHKLFRFTDDELAAVQSLEQDDYMCP
ncbi:MAG: STAS domain-containing protein [Phycisphaerae bacterium]|nr:STAS domain-containing protein [Phycisphaerae bacterium]